VRITVHTIRATQSSMPLPNPAVPGLFDAPAGGGTGNFRRGSGTHKPAASAAFEKKPESTQAPLPESPNTKKIPKKLQLPGVSSTQAPSLFSESDKFFKKATTEGVEKFS
jgi:hypothetical protein